MKTYDISPLISDKLAVFPGDQSFSRKVLLDFKQGHNLLLSTIKTTVHLGAHADAPSHYHPNGTDIASASIEPYIGLCQVINVKLNPGERIKSQNVTQKIKAPRIIFATQSCEDPNKWNPKFNSLSAELVDFLAQNKVRLVGIDTPSIDLAEDKNLQSHQAIYRHRMAVLEGLVLTKVPDGLYTLVALPLKIQDADASPVRAVLFDKDEKFL